MAQPVHQLVPSQSNTAQSNTAQSNNAQSTTTARAATRPRLCGWLVGIVALLCLDGCRPRPVPATQLLAGRTMGTTYSIKIVPNDGMQELIEIASAVEHELSTVNQQMSTYLDESEVSKFNRQASADWFSVSPETVAVVQLAQQLSQQTDGAFDITVGPLVNLWGFGPDGAIESLPDTTQIEEVWQSVGFKFLEERESPPALKKTKPELEVDFSAIAKGHGVDRLADLLTSMGVESYFVEIGGEVRTRGTRIDGSLWRVGIEKPVAGERGVQEVLELGTRALATSGDYRNYFEAEGRRYSHTIDPRTGYPTEDPIVSASVVADTCAMADAIATSMMALGLKDGLECAETNGWSVLLLAHQDDQLVIQASTTFIQEFPSINPGSEEVVP